MCQILIASQKEILVVWGLAVILACVEEFFVKASQYSHTEIHGSPNIYIRFFF